jgi:osomolarity two-component system sensor histidine kinase SLN1
MYRYVCLITNSSLSFQFVPLITLPVTGMIMWDFPRDRDFIYQIWISVATWMWCVIGIFLF